VTVRVRAGGKEEDHRKWSLVRRAVGENIPYLCCLGRCKRGPYCSGQIRAVRKAASCRLRRCKANFSSLELQAGTLSTKIGDLALDSTTNEGSTGNEGGGDQCG